MSVSLRRAFANDAPEIARVMQASGLDDNPDAARIARVIPEHETIVAVEASHIVGFVNAFLTVSAARIPRLEIDLLGVHPDWQGRGIARRLVTASLEMGKQPSARALVRTSNLASRRTFAWCGFQPGAVPVYLYVAEPLHSGARHVPPEAYLLPVITFTYNGLWVEGSLSTNMLLAARALIARYGWQSAGTVIPADALEAIAEAERAGYSQVGEFDWWLL